MSDLKKNHHLPKAHVTVTNPRAASLKVLGLTVLERNLRSLKKAGFQVILNETPDSESRHLSFAGDFQYPASFFQKIKDLVFQNLTQNFTLENSTGKKLPVSWSGTQKKESKIIQITGNRIFNVSKFIEDKKVSKKLSKALFDEIYDNAEGWIARGLNKKISFPITRFLVKFPVTPNQITVLCFFIGLAGCLMFLSASYQTRVVGALLLQFNSILDGCDGEVARLKVISSKVGAWMDTISDDVLINVMLITLCAGYLMEYPNVALIKFCVLGSLACIGMSFFLYHFMITHNTPNAGHYRLSWEKPNRKTVGPSKPSAFDYIKPILKRDFVVFFVMIMIILNQRMALLSLFVPVMGAFVIYFASFLYEIFYRPSLKTENL